MRRFVSWVGVIAIVWVMAVVAAAQGKPSLEQLDRVMKKDGPAQQALVKALVAGNQAVAKQNLLTLQQGIAEAQTFWVANKRTDAVEFTKTVLKKLDGPRQIDQRAHPRFDGRARCGAGPEQVVHRLPQGLSLDGRRRTLHPEARKRSGLI